MLSFLLKRIIFLIGFITISNSISISENFEGKDTKLKYAPTEVLNLNSGSWTFSSKTLMCGREYIDRCSGTSFSCVRGCSGKYEGSFVHTNFNINDVSLITFNYTLRARRPAQMQIYASIDGGNNWGLPLNTYSVPNIQTMEKLFLPEPYIPEAQYKFSFIGGCVNIDDIVFSSGQVETCLCLDISFNNFIGQFGPNGNLPITSGIFPSDCNPTCLAVEQTCSAQYVSVETLIISISLNTPDIMIERFPNDRKIPIKINNVIDIDFYFADLADGGTFSFEIPTAPILSATSITFNANNGQFLFPFCIIGEVTCPQGFEYDWTIKDCILINAPAPAPATASVWTTSGREIHKDGEPFFIRGTTYSPTQISQGPGATVSYDDSAVYEQDIALLKEMGANSVRTYVSFIEPNGVDPKFSAFLDYCAANEIYVIIHLPITGIFDDSYIQKMVNIVTTHKDHPAVMAYCLGNEYNLLKSLDPLEITLVSSIISAAKAIDSNHLYTMALADYNLFDEWIPAYDLYVDFWLTNIYRGSTFGRTYYDYTSTKPLVLGEYGYDSWDSRINSENQEMQMKANLQLAEEIERHSVYNTLNGGQKTSILAGGFIYQLVDHWSTFLPYDQQNVVDGSSNNSPDGQRDFEYWGILSANIGTPNARIPKDIYYALKDMWTSCDYLLPLREDNQFQNGAFDWDLSGWYRKGISKATWTTSNNILSITNIQPTATVDIMELYQTGFDASATSYTYSFKIRLLSSTPRDITHYVTENPGMWPPLSSLGSQTTTTITVQAPDWQIVTRTFTPSRVSTDDAKFVIRFGADTTPFEVTDFTMNGMIYSDSSLSLCTPVSAPAALIDFGGSVLF